MAKKLKEEIKAVYKLLLEEIRKLNYNEELRQSRLTFSNPRRVVAVEARKHYILLHLPKKKNLEELLVKDEKTQVDHIEPFEVTYDGRGWAFVRVSSVEQIPRAVEIVEFASKHNLA